MSGASFILAINLFIAALFALAFLIIAATNRNDRVAGWFSLAYVFGLAYIGSEFILPVQGNPQFAYTAGFAAFLGAVTAITVGIAIRYRQQPSWALIGAGAAAAIALNWIAYDFHRDSLVRMFAYQAPYAMMQAVAALVVLRSGRRKPMDLGLALLFILSALQFLSKPFVALLSGGAGDSATSYLGTSYALYSQSLGAVLQVAIGLLMLMLLVRDMLMEVTLRSETDVLSGLYNRRGFDERAGPLLDAATAHLPASLVICDLDSFKSINDNHGHDAGDGVIVAFARLLQINPPRDAVLGRIGGEEFAILLPETHLEAARIYAESLRTGFASLEIDALPPRTFCTASFGVAQFDGRESLSDLRRRADAALYESKRGGRDRISIARPAETDAMPEHPLSGTSAMRAS